MAAGLVTSGGGQRLVPTAWWGLCHRVPCPCVRGSLLSGLFPGPCSVARFWRLAARFAGRALLAWAWRERIDEVSLRRVCVGGAVALPGRCCLLLAVSSGGARVSSPAERQLGLFPGGGRSGGWICGRGVGWVGRPYVPARWDWAQVRSELRPTLHNLC